VDKRQVHAEGVSGGAFGRSVSCEKVEVDGGHARWLLAEEGEKEESKSHLGAWVRWKKGTVQSASIHVEGAGGNGPSGRQDGWPAAGVARARCHPK
jgi:hypothetical protein